LKLWKIKDYGNWFYRFLTEKILKYQDKCLDVKNKDSKYFRENEQAIPNFSRILEDLVKFIMRFKL
jgi:hypothetical protein